MHKHSIIIRALGLFLISTGAFKFFTDQSIINLWFVVPLEIIVGVFSLLRPKLNTTHWALLFLFATFSIYTTTNIFQNSDDCGCLGAITINPWFTLVFDISVLTYLLILKRIDNQTMKILVPTCVTMAASLLATIIYFQLNTAITPSTQTSVTNNTNLPEISSLNISNPLSSTNLKTEKTIFIYDQHCPLCLNIASQPTFDAIDISQAQDYMQNDPSNADHSNRTSLPWVLTNVKTKPKIHSFSLLEQSNLDIKQKHLHIGSFKHPQTIDLGQITANAQTSIPVFMLNDSNIDMSVKTFRSTCSCIKTTCDNKSIKANDYLQFNLTFHAPSKAIENYQQTIRIRTTNDDIPSINLLVQTKIIRPK